VEDRQIKTANALNLRIDISKCPYSESGEFREPANSKQDRILYRSRIILR
jgi:hypothetical protein